jgi:hypothetical protein
MSDPLRQLWGDMQHRSSKRPFDSRQLTLDFRVKVEPDSDEELLGKTPEEILALGRWFYRLAKQCFLIAWCFRKTLPCMA